MTTQEKRAERFRRFLTAEGKQFIDQDTEKAYKARAKQISDAAKEYGTYA